MLNNKEFSNQYYHELIGGATKNDPVSVLINDAPGWRRTTMEGPQHWRGDPPSVGKIIMVRVIIRDRQMLLGTNVVTLSFSHTTTTGSLDFLFQLNTDIALVRRLDSSNMDTSNGNVTCTFEPSDPDSRNVGVCPHVEGALQIAAEFKHDNLGWLRAFESVLDRMLSNGYKRNSCSDRICKLQK